MTSTDIKKIQDTSITYRPHRLEDTSQRRSEYMFTSPFVNDSDTTEDEYTQIYNEENSKFDYDSYNSSKKKYPWWAWMWSTMFFMVFFPTNLSLLLESSSRSLDSVILTISTVMLIVSVIPLSLMFILRYIRS